MISVLQMPIQDLLKTHHPTAVLFFKCHVDYSKPGKAEYEIKMGRGFQVCPVQFEPCFDYKELEQKAIYTESVFIPVAG